MYSLVLYGGRIIPIKIPSPLSSFIRYPLPPVDLPPLIGITWRREICQDLLPGVGRRRSWPGRVGSSAL